MKALVQRVTEARVDIDGATVGAIGQGALVLLGVEAGDDEVSAKTLFDKLLAYRIFSDPDGKMNLSVRDIKGEVLLVSQFTLCADTRKGLRPGFSRAAPPKDAEALYNYATDYVRSEIGQVQTGRFAADMQVQLVNDGPVTFMLEVAPS